jgi:photosystem II stability/assembly factor-like uncharacterized protein
MIASVSSPQGGTGAIAFAQCKQGLSFIDPTHGFLGAWGNLARPTIYRTSDGGRSWAGATLPDPPGFVTQGGPGLRAGLVNGFGSNLLVLAMSEQGDGYVFRSTDGGTSWAYVARAGGYAYSFTFVAASRWLVIGNDSSAVETTDAGKTWHPYTTDYSNAAGVGTVFVFGDAQVGYGTVRGGIERTVDGGAHWSIIQTPGVLSPG